MRRLPRIIRLPGGFVIEVKKQRLVGVHGSWDYCLEANCGIIKIDKRADLARQWRTLGHELHHAMTDYNLWLDYNIRGLETEMGRTAADLRGDD